MSEEATLDDFGQENSGSISSGDWQERELHQVTQITMGSSPKSEYYNNDGDGLPFFQSNNEFGFRHPEHDRWCSNPQKIAKSGDLLMTIRGTYVGQMNLADRESCIGRGLAGITPGEQVNGEFLFQQLNYIEPHIKSIAIGSTFDSISSAEIDSLEIDLPPLSEQRKIATVLHTVDQAIQKTEEIIEQKERIKSGLLESLLTEGYFEHSKWRTIDSQDAYLMSRGSKLPAEWDIYESDEITIIKMGHTPDTSVGEYWNGDIPWIDIHDMTTLGGTKIYTTDDNITKQGLENSGAKLLPKGTVVLCRTGDIGRSAILGKTMATHQQLVSFECDETKLRPHYLMYVFRYASSQLKRFSVGSTHKQIQLHFFSDLKIPLPDIDEQDKIVGVLEQVDKSIEVQKKKINQLQEVKQGLMQDLLSGEVRTSDAKIKIPEEVA